MTDVAERRSLQELAERSGWERREMERIDVFHKGTKNVEVHWTGDAVTGGTLSHDYHMFSHTRDVATVKGWLAR